MKGDDSKCWKFHHSKFVKGREDLLPHIRRTNQFPNNNNNIQDQQDIQNLKKDLGSLKNSISCVDTGIENLSSCIKRLDLQHINHVQHETHQYSNGNTLKRKHNDPILNSASTVDLSVVKDIDLLVEEFPPHKSTVELPQDCTAQQTTPVISSRVPIHLNRENSSTGLVKDQRIIPSSSNVQQEKMSSFSDLFTMKHEECTPDFVPSDMELVHFPLFKDDTKAEHHKQPPETVTPARVLSSSDTITTDESAATSMDVNPDVPDHIQRLYDCLAVLPKEHQVEVVDNLCKKVSNTNFFKEHVDAVTALVNIAAEAMKNAEVNNDPKMAKKKEGSKQLSESDINGTTKNSLSSSSNLMDTTNLKLMTATLSAVISKHGASAAAAAAAKTTTKTQNHQQALNYRDCARDKENHNNYSTIRV